MSLAGAASYWMLVSQHWQWLCCHFCHFLWRYCIQTNFWHGVSDQCSCSIVTTTVQCITVELEEWDRHTDVSQNCLMPPTIEKGHKKWQAVYQMHSVPCSPNMKGMQPKVTMRQLRLYTYAMCAACQWWERMMCLLRLLSSVNLFSHMPHLCDLLPVCTTMCRFRLLLKPNCRWQSLHL